MVVANNTIELIPTLCTLSHLHIFIHHLNGVVTVNLFRSLSGTLHIMEIVHYWCSSTTGQQASLAAGFGALTPHVSMIWYRTLHCL